MSVDRPILVLFFRLDSGREPVMNWLRGMDAASRRTIGEDIKTLQFGWPVGMPLARKMDTDLWELRSNLASGITRTFFTIHEDNIVLLHGFVEKSQKTPANELATAKRRLTKFSDTAMDAPSRETRRLHRLTMKPASST
ncbi:MAG: type II toxin-antitoxin system RelE/ParE family toxin [Gammaproteobacteria bacterium]|nr:type II toxin-antitoxin system RelE/ParE family toxin [Gammaproteobacteria bacterium]